MLALSRWGSRSLRDPRPGDAPTANALLVALRASFQPAGNESLSFKLHLGEMVVHARVEDGRLEVGEEPLPEADLTLETDLTLVDILEGTLGPEDTIGRGSLTVTGDRRRLEQLTRLFSFPAPVAAAR